MPYFGEILSLSCSVIWAFSVILFKKSGERVHPIALNLFKISLAFVLYIPTIMILKQPIIRNIPINEYILFISSGILGVGIADTLFFYSLNKLGAGLNAIIGCLYSPLIIALSVVFLGEKMSLIQIIGVIAIISAVLSITGVKTRANISRKNFILGIILGILSTAFMAISIIMVKTPLEHTPILWAIETRLFGGLIFLLTFLIFHPDRARFMKSLFRTGKWKYTISGSFLGNYIALILWLGGMKYALVSVASALNQTSNIFVFVFAAIFLGEKMTTTKTIAILVGVLGAFLVTFG
ncbi:DMT family transporter [bacterium]|nr:DMT family transporter [bacterium]